MKLNYLFMLLPFLSCTQQNNLEKNILVETPINDIITLDSIQNDIYSRDVFESIEFIPLETNRSNLFSDISDMLIIGDRYYILNRSINQVLIFDSEGRFLGTFDGKSDVDEIQFLQLRKSNKPDLIYVRDGNTSSIISFTGSGKYISRKEVKSDFYSFAPIGNKFVIYNHYLTREEISKGDDKKYLIDLIDTSSMKTVDSYIGYNEKSIYKGEIPNNWKNFYECGNELFLTIQGQLNYYKISEEGILSTTEIKLNRPNLFQIPNDFIVNPEYFGKRSEYLDRNKKEFYNIRSIFKTKNGVIYTLGNRSRPINLLSLSGRGNILESDIKYESDTKTLPPISYFVYGSDEEYFYSYYPSKQFLDAMNEVPNRNSILSENENLRSVYNKINMLSNGVIVKFKLKDVKINKL
ncbi:6-bladed beta-propeller [Sphingobacterium sp. BIGb0165]|uniref:6-bladed beta-propeller n=1 Tax=Sphingobacterium sp. BIGb0165 TaxID=2940615 RepID=UPI002169DB64|nr:6-bladed beta-propeller [Sphingobacterium sp. BIGb0165]MCS4226915.1 hypothetical protein [Sphingobacterium sp. BIGb0165]